MNKRLMRCGAAIVLSVLSSWVAAQQQVSLPPGATSAVLPAPKDARTRAIAHAELGSLYFQNGDLIIALEEMTLAAAIDPDYAPAFSSRGLILYHLSELASAEKDFQRAIDLDERNPDINNNYGWFLCQTGRAKESLAYFEKAYRTPVYQTPAIAYRNAGNCNAKLNDLDAAEDALRKSLRLAPNNPQTLFYLANVSYLRGNFDAAKKQLGDAIRQVDPGPDFLWLALRVERRLGNQSDEQSYTAQLRRKFPDSTEFQEFLKGNFE